MKQIQLVTAVLATLKSFREDIFSIYNLTSSIREDVASGDYTLTNLGTTVNHEDVKVAFGEIMGVIGDIYDVNDSGKGYREFQMKVLFQPDVNTPIIPMISDDTMTDIVRNSKIPASIQAKIADYLGNSVIPRSMKQIQSRLKGHNYTCQDLVDLISKIGLIDKSTLNLPASKIMTLEIKD